MKIATFNINNINRRLPNLLRWLHQARPDVVCLQELKSTDEDFSLRAIDKAGYGAVVDGKFIKFDEKGNELAKAALMKSDKKDNLRADVTGKMKDGVIDVSSLKLE